MKKLLLVLLICSLLAGCAVKKEEKVENNAPIILATTTSTENSGLLDFILPNFIEKYGREVKVVAVGTGKTLELGQNGEADVLLVHAKSSEIEFVEAGHGTERFDVMYNDFLLVGPKGQQVIEPNASDIVKALKKLEETKAIFISRGDDSGTHKKELSIWETMGIEPRGDWYVSAGKGMGDTIIMADEMLGYTITDRATYLSMKNDLQLDVVVEGDSSLFNQYGVIPVNPSKSDLINAEGANEFVEWILSKECQELIGQFGVAEYGEPLFMPNAQ